MTSTFLVLHGVNLNMLGQRDPHHYGTLTLDEINHQLLLLAQQCHVNIECFQTNHEGAMVEKIHQAHLEKVKGVLINAGAWTHYSYAIADALTILNCPIIEVHLSDIHKREAFRHHSCFSSLVKKQISGLGLNSYLQGLTALIELARDKP